MISSVTPGTKLNITGISFSYFAAGAFGEFLAYFLIGLIIFLIFNKSTKQSSEDIETQRTIDIKDEVGNKLND